MIDQGAADLELANKRRAKEELIRKQRELRDQLDIEIIEKNKLQERFKSMQSTPTI